MPAHAKIEELADWVRATLGRGIHLDAALLACLESTFGTPDPGVLLADMQAGEAASFLELIFSPDRAVCHAYEVRWGRQPFPPAAVQTLEEIMVAAPVPSALHMPDGNEPLGLEVPDFALRSFVRRLNIAWQPPGALERVLDTHLDDDLRPTVRALLRHVRLPWFEHQVSLLDLFFSKGMPATDDFESDLPFFCGLLDEYAPDQAPFDFLMAKKRFYFQALCKAQAFEQRLRSGAMELLMLQGARAAYGDIEQWRAWMRQVDRISMVLFAETRYFQEPRVVGLDPVD
jgi:hypothetical protein